MAIGLYRVQGEATLVVQAETAEAAKHAVETLFTSLPVPVANLIAYGVTSADDVAREQMIEHYIHLLQTDEDWQQHEHFDCLCPPEAYEADRRYYASQESSE